MSITFKLSPKERIYLYTERELYKEQKKKFSDQFNINKMYIKILQKKKNEHNFRSKKVFQMTGSRWEVKIPTLDGVDVGEGAVGCSEISFKIISRWNSFVAFTCIYSTASPLLSVSLFISCLFSP